MASKASLPEYSKVARWTVNDVCNWLMENKFSNFVPMFRESGVDGCRLAELSDVDLLKMRCPHNKKLDLLRCIENIPGKNDVRGRGPASLPPSIGHRPPPSAPQPASHYPPQNGAPADTREPPSQDSIDEDDFSGPDDDYEWNDFEDEVSGSDSGSDYENNPQLKKDSRNSGSVSTPPRPSRQNAGQATIAAKLRTALKERQNQAAQEEEDDEGTDSGSDYDKPDPPQAPPPRPSRPGQSAGRLPPPIPKGNNKPSPVVGRKGRPAVPAPAPESDQPQYLETDIPGLEQSDYEDPDAAPITPQRPGRVPQPLPSRPSPGNRKPPPRQPDPEPEENYEVPEEHETRPPPPRPNQKKAQPPKSSAMSRQPPPIPTHVDEPQELYEDPDADSSGPTADDVYEDPDAEPPPQRPSQLKFNKNVPPIPKPGVKGSRPPPVPRTDSQPDIPAPPVPRHHRREPPKLPTPTKGKTHAPDSEEEPDDYEKPSSSPAEPKPLPPRPGKKKVPSLDDLPGYMDMAPKEPDVTEQENYEEPDPEIVKSSHTKPSHDRHKKKRGSPPPLPTESEEKAKVPYRPVGAVPIIPIANGHQSKADQTDSKGAFRENRTPQPAPRPIPHPRTRSPAITKDDETFKHRKLPPEPSSTKSEPHPATSPTSSHTHRKGSVLSRPLPSKPTAEDGEIKDYAWFHDITRQIADRELQRYAKNGMFLVRRSTKQGQPYTLVIFSENKIYNLPIRQLDIGQFALGKFKKGEQTFDHVSDLIEFFKTHTLILAASGSGQTRLKQALPR